MCRGSSGNFKRGETQLLVDFKTLFLFLKFEVRKFEESDQRSNVRRSVLTAIFFHDDENRILNGDEIFEC